MLLGDVEVCLREVLDKRWCDGGKILTFLRFLCSIRLTLVKPSGKKNTIVENKKDLLYYEYSVFCTENRVIHREQSF